MGVSYVLMTENEAFSGVKRTAEKVAEDFRRVTGTRPELRTEVGADDFRKAAEEETAVLEKAAKETGTGQEIVILAATLGHSPLVEKLVESGLLSENPIDRIQGKREVYLRVFLPEALDGKDLVLILGSDKRGTIYGLFSLSEYIGVTPLTFFGDAPLVHRKELILGEAVNAVSKEPSVEYRGFFINDEWPAFGSWCMEHFGGFNASLYDCVFEFLLRMKGNYIWPAMWTSSFPLDGPGPADMELADEYGVIWSFSHHEPCLRASEEWDKVRGEASPYGNAWDFRTNREGLLRYWGDALKERGRYENMITIGMRGERDSALLGEESPVEDNVALLKEIITAQRGVICSLEQEGLVRENAPQMLAVYKEVEEYYYGNEKISGLYQWDGLDGVICMLSDDNFGHLRTLPTSQMREHKGGYGMYYHLDYHGSPVSYEWVESTPFSQVWEQMTEAWDYGVRKLWIVNVGDVKFHEVLLQYFMDLAYDYERFGGEEPERYLRYPEHLIRKNFPEELPGMDGELQKKITKVLTDYLHLAELRRPESLHTGIYHASHELETDRMLEITASLDARNHEILHRLSEKEESAAAYRGYYSMIGWPCAAMCNLVRLYLFAGKNHRYAQQGRPAAGICAQKAKECLRRDKELSAEWAAFLGGKWSGMEKPHHIGFTQWNDFGRQYPVLMELEPAEDPILCVSRADEDETAVRVYGSHEKLVVDDFRYEGNREVLLEISNNGTGALSFEIRNLPDWLRIENETDLKFRQTAAGELSSAQPSSGQLSTGQLSTGELARVSLSVLRENLPDGPEEVSTVLELAGSDETIVDIPVTAREKRTALPGQGRNGVLVLEAENLIPGKAAEKASWKPLSSYGKYGGGWKVYPTTAAFAAGDAAAPSLFGELEICEEGDYVVELHAAPSNPLEFVKPLTLGLMLEQKPEETAEDRKAMRQQAELTLVRAERTVGSPSNAAWCRAVLDQERMAQTVFHLPEGRYKLSIFAREAGVIPERIYVYPEKVPMPESYLGPNRTKSQKVCNR